MGRNCILPAAFGRLCVETIELELIDDYGMAAAFGRLCVETMNLSKKENCSVSRLRAAVC